MTQRMPHKRVSSRAPVAAMASVAFLTAFSTFLISAYNPEQDDVKNAPMPARWPSNSVTWNLNPKTGSNVAPGSDVRTALTNAFNSWQNAQLNGQTVDNLTITPGADTTLTSPNSSDCLNVVGFADSNAKDFPTGVIAFTDLITSFGPPPTTYSCTTPPTSRTCSLPSCIIDADIEFNPKEQFSTSTPPLAAHFDVQSVGTHEIGHLLGLDHSGIAHAIMYPFGDTEATGQQRTLAIDDTAGIAFLYPASNFASSTGTISGAIKLNGAGIFAAHVVAVDANSGAAVLDGLTNPDGTYKLVGVPPGTYNVLALPLAGVYTLNDFSGWSCGYGENSPPCCDPNNPPNNPNCKGKPVPNPNNYTGKFF